MLKRVYYPINKAKIQEAIDLYNQHHEQEPHMSHDESLELWGKYSDAFAEICPGSNAWVLNIFQGMHWSGTLDVEHVYNTILASGANTKLEDCDNE